MFEILHVFREKKTFFSIRFAGKWAPVRNSKSFEIFRLSIFRTLGENGFYAPVVFMSEKFQMVVLSFHAKSVAYRQPQNKQMFQCGQLILHYSNNMDRVSKKKPLNKTKQHSWRTLIGNIEFGKWETKWTRLLNVNHAARNLRPGFKPVLMPDKQVIGPIQIYNFLEPEWAVNSRY